MKHYDVAAWLTGGLLLVILANVMIIFMRHVRLHPPVRGSRAGIVPLIYVGVLEISVIQEVIFYPA